MEKRTDSPYPRLDRPVLAVDRRRCSWSPRCSSRGTTASTSGATTSASSSSQVAEKFGADKAKTVPIGHAADLGPGPRPRRPLHHLPPGHRLEGLRDRRRARSAPTRAEPLKSHPPEKFGCTVLPRRPGLGDRHGAGARARRALGGAAARQAARRGLLARRRQERADADELQRLPPLRPRDARAPTSSTSRKQLVQREGLPRLPRDQRPRRHDRPRPHLRRRQGARAVRVRPALRAEDGLRLARGALQGPARARPGHGDAELQLHHEGGAGAGDAGAVLAQGAGARRVRRRACRAPTRRPPRRRRTSSA